MAQSGFVHRKGGSVCYEHVVMFLQHFISTTVAETSQLSGIVWLKDIISLSMKVKLFENSKMMLCLIAYNHQNRVFVKQTSYKHFAGILCMQKHNSLKKPDRYFANQCMYC